MIGIRSLAVIAGIVLGTIGMSLEGIAFSQAPPACNSPTGPFCNAVVPPPAGWPGRVFVLNQTYPATAPADSQPWLAFDPTNQPDQYIKAVLAYFYEGNIQPDVEASFDPTLNRVRGWYNAPWQDFGTNGREPIHGLTRERVSRPFELGPQQSRAWNNYAVGFYNALGATTIGRVWADHGNPNPSLGAMPEGTAAAKLLFTTAPASEVPYLQGSPTWNAYIYANPNDPAPKPTSLRSIMQVRLLQIDVAVKDARVGAKTGWVFGTFVYGGGPGGQQGAGWANVAPVGLMWGNDLTQTNLNPAVHMPHVGYQGRLNGPVDNAASSCLSCHSTAEFPAGVMIPPAGADPAPWFRNIQSGVAFDAGRQALDYSLQLAVGLTNFKAAQTLAQQPTPAHFRNVARRIIETDVRPPRDGGPLH